MEDFNAPDVSSKISSKNDESPGKTTVKLVPGETKPSGANTNDSDGFSIHILSSDGIGLFKLFLAGDCEELALYTFIPLLIGQNRMVLLE